MKEGHRDRKESEHSELGDEEPENSESVIVNSELELNAKQKRAWEQWSSEDKGQNFSEAFFFKFIHSEKATKFCENLHLTFVCMYCRQK